MSSIESVIFKHSISRQISIIGLTLIASLLFVSFGLLIRYIIDNPNYISQLPGLITFCAIFIFIRLAMPSTYAVIESLTHHHCMTLESLLRASYFDTFNHLYAEYLESNRRNELIATYETAMNAINSYVRTLWGEALPVIFQTFFILSSIAVYLSMETALIFLLVIILYTYTVITLTNRRFPLMRQVAHNQKMMNGMVHSLLLAGFTAKAYDASTRFGKKYRTSVDRYMNAQNNIRSAFFKFGLTTSTVSVIGSTILLSSAAIGYKNGELTLGGIIMLTTFLFQVFLPLNRIGVLWRTLNKARIDFSLLEENLKTQTPYPASTQHMPSPQGNLNIELQDITKQKQDTSIFEKLNTTISISPSQPTFITGKNGSGKSTLARLISGIDIPNEGKIIFNTTPRALEAYGSSSAWLAISCQSIVFVNGTIGENLQCFLGDYKTEHYQVLSERLSLQKHINFEIGDQARNLSAGERQKLSLILAILKKPYLLVLDEPTNHLDASSTRELTDVIRELLHSTRVLIITHDMELLSQFKSPTTYNVAKGRVTEVIETERESQ
ncbi:TPA: ABC transporter ATP-binding protein [Pseudomonas putida]|uniref:ATP-binding cassette domain-containing protein n=1 Tax=Pseudomonas putida TaxID=303 RepID=UPI0023631BE5|nr:ABC transporter ATP-binding protein [Pseudomonas putida]MDD2011839.1 ABC transporter ATP-binding protein/permease [Pseudomonas putida]HDS1779635.1 ABC transporter ATP-binding protein [Pseudomonas putida]